MAQFEAIPDPGASASDVEKVNYYIKNGYIYYVKKCLRFGLRAPFEVCKRTEFGEGVYEVYFSDENHLRNYSHQLYEVEFDEDLGKMVDVAFGTREEDVNRQILYGAPLQIVWSYPTYNALVREVYLVGQELEAALSREAKEEQEAAAGAAEEQRNHAVAAAAATARPYIIPQPPAQTTFLSQTMQQINAMQEFNNAQMLQFNQRWGFEPTKVVNGVPHFNDPHTSHYF